MTKIIGVSSAHDSSLCVYNKGKIEYFIKEERLSRIKRDKMPILALNGFNYSNEELDLAYSSPIEDVNSFHNYLGIARKTHNIKNVYDYSNEHHLVHANLAFFNIFCRLRALVLFLETTLLIFFLFIIKTKHDF